MYKYSTLFILFIWAKHKPSSVPLPGRWPSIWDHCCQQPHAT